MTLTPLTIFGFITTFLLVIIGVLVFLYFEKEDKLKNQAKIIHDLERSFNDLDEQAKLIVRTDLDLNKAQEELDKRLTGLDALQKISRLITTTLDENEIFRHLNQPLLNEMGFERFLIFSLEKDKKLKIRVKLGFSQEEITFIMTTLAKNAELSEFLRKKMILSSIDKQDKPASSLPQIFNLKNYVLTPFGAQNEILGFIYAGNHSDAYPVTEGDEELISILSDQIGQSIKNARLFEQVYTSSQELEMKVQDRTRQLSSAFEEVQRISKMKTEFISAVSHELRTPLTSIKGYASILITGKIGEIPDKVKERLEKINKHSDNLVKLINDLLDISRIESGRTEMKVAKYSLNEIVDNVQDLLTPQLKEKNIQFVSNLAPDLPEALVDASQAERIFINLIGNAIKFTPQEGTISVKATHDKDNITVTVSDSGIGINKEDAAKLFDEFYRVDNEINQNVKGTGLGLALAKNIIEAHRGNIWVTSQPGEGTSFYFTLPHSKAEEKLS